MSTESRWRAAFRQSNAIWKKESSSAKLTEADRDETLQRIRGTTRLEDAAQADLIIEAAPEQLELKQQILRELESFAARARSYSPPILHRSLSRKSRRLLKNPGRVVGMHFFNPVHLMRLVEIVVGKATADETVAAVREVGRRMRKETIVVKDVPGFASSRLGVALGLEAMRMFEQGVASAPDIDKAMELGYNHPMGPLKVNRPGGPGCASEHR